MDMAELNLQWVTVNVYQGSLLERDLAAPSGPGFPLGEGLQPRVTAGMVYDTRDHETAPAKAPITTPPFAAGARCRQGTRTARST